THEHWPTYPGRPWVVYQAKVEQYLRRQTVTTLRLRYDEADQTDDLVRNRANGVRWGVSNFRWNRADMTASARWTDDNDNYYNGMSPRVEILGGQDPVRRDALRRIIT